jgi:hypothetical protein
MNYFALRVRVLLALFISIFAVSAQVAIGTTPVISPWQYEGDDGLGLDNSVQTTTHDLAGNIYVAVTTNDGMFTESVIYKFDQYGDLLWSCPNFWANVQINALAVNSYGTVFATGAFSENQIDTAFIYSISNIGQPIGLSEVASPEGHNIAGTAIGFDPSQNTILVCSNEYSTSGNSYDLVIAQFLLNGALTGTREISAINPGNELAPQNYSFDTKGDLFVAGGANGSTGGIWEEISPSGSLIQQATFPDQVNGSTTTQTVANVRLDSANDVFVTTNSIVYINNNFSSENFVVHAYNPQMVLQWQSTPKPALGFEVEPYSLNVVDVLAVTSGNNEIGYLFGTGGANLVAYPTTSSTNILPDGTNGFVLVTPYSSGGTNAVSLQKVLQNGTADWSANTYVAGDNTEVQSVWMVNGTVHLAGVIEDRWEHFLLSNFAEGTSVSQLSFSPNQNQGGGSLTGTLTLNAPATGGGIYVTLTSSYDAELGVPTVVVVPPGKKSVNFTATATAVDTYQTVTVSALTNHVRTQATVLLKPGILNSLQLPKTSVVGGTSVTGTVKISSIAGPGGRQVQLSSTSADATVPTYAFIEPGQTSATFTIATKAVTSSTAVTIKATSNSVTESAGLTLTP